MIRTLLVLAAVAMTSCATTNQFKSGEELRCRKRSVKLLEQSADLKRCTVEQQVSMGLFEVPVVGTLDCENCESVN
jgi:hypothetical protein